MPRDVVVARRDDDRAFLVAHALLIPGALALAAITAQASGLDERIAAAFFDPATGAFAARGWPALELLGHRVAKSAIWAVWLALVGAALVAPVAPRLTCEPRVLWLTVVAMALGPVIVVGLKDLNAYHCPWDLKRFGGFADVATAWFVPPVDAGHCFPSGHAAGGFSLVALGFAGRASGNRRLQTAGLVAALAAGTAFSAVRVVQGAHFLSHNLWSAAIDWWAAALVFAPQLLRARHRTAKPGAA